jgi:hypothetical protein
VQPSSAIEHAASTPAPQPSEPAQVAAVEEPAAALPEIELPAGVTLRREAHAQSYVFDDALFSEGVRFTAGARERLTALGRALEPHLDAIAIELVGHVDSNPESADVRRYHDNTELALSRANAALGRLVRTTHIPAERLGLRTAGEQPGPFEGASNPRNRTVEIRVEARRLR